MLGRPWCCSRQVCSAPCQCICTSLLCSPAKVAAGPVAVPGGRSWQLIDCAPVDPQGPGGVKALLALKQHLSDVLEVMLPAFGERGC